MSDSVHYVMILDIQKITKTTNSQRAYHNTPASTEEKREKRDIAKFVISDSDLNRLIQRGSKHLTLVQDEETEVQ